MYNILYLKCTCQDLVNGMDSSSKTLSTILRISES